MDGFSELFDDSDFDFTGQAYVLRVERAAKGLHAAPPRALIWNPL